MSGSQHYNGLLPAFSDAAPDRWGRNLINRDSTTWRRARELDEVDYLLAVSDDIRQGALRFKPRNSDTFVGPPSVVPPFISLPTLLHTAREVADSDEYIQAVKVLLDTGTSALGGARPKASILCPDGSLGMAKFPHPSDDWDVIGWEYATSCSPTRAASMSPIFASYLSQTPMSLCYDASIAAVLSKRITVYLSSAP